MRPRRNRFAWLFVMLRWTALGMVFWPVVGVGLATMFFGMRAVVIDGESMHPALRRGDVVLADPSPSGFSSGQVVMFDAGNGRTMHRLVRLTDRGWITAGDANQRYDSGFIASEDVEALGVFVVPYVGWLRTQPASVAALLAVGIGAVTGLSFTSVRLRTSTAATAIVVLTGLAAAPSTGAAFITTTGTPNSSVTASSLASPSNLIVTSGCGLIVLGPFVDVSWDVLSIEGIVGFEVQRAPTADGPFSTVASKSPADRSHRDQGVSGLSTYWYRVVAISSTWASEPSNVDEASTGLCL